LRLYIVYTDLEFALGPLAHPAHRAHRARSSLSKLHPEQMQTLESLSRKIEGAKDIKSVVRTMKAMAAATIGQYELAVSSLGDYYQTVALGLVAYFQSEPAGNPTPPVQEPQKVAEPLIGALVFGSDQGLVGSFNDTLAAFVAQTLGTLPGSKQLWTVGERVQHLLTDAGLPVTTHFLVPTGITAITPLVAQMLLKAQEAIDNGSLTAFYIFHNRPREATGYEPVYQRLLPLDAQWKQELRALHWPTKTRPQVAGARFPTLRALVGEFLFVSLFRACAESLASENASRLKAMQRAEKSIDELLGELAHQYHHKRQSAIDEELFDVVSGFEALNADHAKEKRE
jgi:F-type H+-transporting ATPase subunit gamma